MKTDKFLVGLDRDGTINVDVGHFGKSSEWKSQLVIYPFVTEGIRRLKAEPTASVVVATNQAGVARGFYGRERVGEINSYIDGLLRAGGAFIDGWYYCPFVGKGYADANNLSPDNPWVVESDMRKPGTGMLKQAAKDLGVSLDGLPVYFVGDTKGDVQTGLNAKGKGVLVLNEKNQKEYVKVKEMEQSSSGRIFFADNMLVAAEIILDDHRKG